MNAGSRGQASLRRVGAIDFERLTEQPTVQLVNPSQMREKRK